MRASAYVVLRQFLLLDTNGQGRLSFASWCQGILAQPQLLQCFTLSLPPPPLHPVSSTESMTQGRLSAEHSPSSPAAEGFLVPMAMLAMLPWWQIRSEGR